MSKPTSLRMVPAIWLIIFSSTPAVLRHWPYFGSTEVAHFWKGKPVPAWAKRPVGVPESLGTRLKLWPLRLLAHWILKPDGGNRWHYQAQAHWLLQAMQLRWPPHDPAETQLFRTLLRGDLTVLPKYGQCLKTVGVEPKIINQMAGTIRKLVGLLNPL